MKRKNVLLILLAGNDYGFVKMIIAFKTTQPISMILSNELKDVLEKRAFRFGGTAGKENCTTSWSYVTINPIALKENETLIFSVIVLIKS